MLTGQYFINTFPEIDTTGDGSASLHGTVVVIYDISLQGTESKSIAVCG